MDVLNDNELGVVQFLKDNEGEYMSPSDIATAVFEDSSLSVSRLTAVMCRKLQRYGLVEKEAVSGAYRAKAGQNAS